MSFPPPELFTNRSRGRKWQATHTIKNNYKIFCGWDCLKVNKWTQPGLIPLHITFHPPHNRYDLDNMYSAFKIGQDILAVRMGVNDKRFRPVTLDVAEATKQPKVVIKVGYDL